ncbi:MAG: DUF4123 domain-containing protein [Pseudomonadota bacterium]
MLSHRDIWQLYQALPASTPGCYLYGLADHAGMPGLAKRLVRDRADWVSLFEGSTEEGALSVAPLLFQIEVIEGRVTQDLLLDWVCEHGTYTSSLLFLASPLSTRDLAQRLARRLNAVLSEDMDVMLRFFDPRIFASLLDVLSAEQQQAFLSVGNCWWFVNRHGHLQQVKAQFSDEDGYNHPIRLTAEQEHALVEISEPDQVAELLEAGAPDEYGALPWPDRHDFIVRHMAAAKSIGIDATHELAQYCLLALLHGEGFLEQRKWHAVLQDVQTGKLNLGQAVAQAEGINGE